MHDQFSFSFLIAFFSVVTKLFDGTLFCYRYSLYIGLKCHTIYGVEDVEIILEWVSLSFMKQLFPMSIYQISATAYGIKS